VTFKAIYLNLSIVLVFNVETITLLKLVLFPCQRGEGVKSFLLIRVPEDNGSYTAVPRSEHFALMYSDHVFWAEHPVMLKSYAYVSEEHATSIFRID
jgi:hypothetical protein